MKRAIAIILALCLALLSGCWDSREIDELGLVMAVGIDKDFSTNDYIVTAQIANQRGFSQQGSGSSSQAEQIYIASAKGKSLFEAVRALSKASSKRIMWAHNNIVIIGESVARDSILPVVDFFTHNPESRLKTAVVISEGDAKDYVAIKSGTEDIPGVSYTSIYNYDWLTGEYIETDLLDVCHSIYSEFRQPIVSKIRFSNNRLMPSQDVPAKTVEQVEFGGAAVFSEDKMLGWLTPDETRGLAWVRNETRNTVVPVQDPSDPGRYVSVEMHSVTADIKSNVSGGQPSVTLNVSGTGNITEEGASKTLPMQQFKTAVAGLVARQIVNDISACLYKVQKEYKSDVLGLADYIHGEHDAEWENGIMQRWSEIYPGMPVTISVKVSINDSTLFQTPLQTPQKY